MDFVVMNDFKLENWLPMEPAMGPPLPRFLNILWPWYKPPLPEPPEMGVVVVLLNPPFGGNYWQLLLFNEVWGDSVRVGQHIPIDQPITLESLPAGWAFPLYIDIMIYELNVSPYNILYRIQSAYGPDFPEDYNKDLIIPDYGSYYYNVATGKIEKA